MKTLLKTISIICVCFVIQAFQITAFSIEGRIAKWEDNKKAAITLTFDDWCPGHYTKVIPELEARNMVGTFYVITGSATPTLNTLKEAAAKGHELGNHTVTHFYPTTPAEYEREIGGAKTWLDKNVGRVYTYGYAFGSHDNNMIAYTKASGHIAGRTVLRPSGNDFTYNFATTEDDYYRLKTASIEDYFVNNGCGSTCTFVSMTPEKWQQYANTIEAVISGGGYLSFCYHGINPPDSPTGYWATISVDLFKEYLDKLEEYGEDIWIATMANVIKYHRQVKFGNASLEEIEAPADNKWVVNLTHTLDQETYDYPLTIMLKMNGVDYNRVTQDGGYDLPFKKLGNDTIMIKAVPNGGHITLEVSNILIEAEISPKSVLDIISKGVTISGSATVAVVDLSTEIATVTVDLSEVGGPSALPLNIENGVYPFEYKITEELTAGNKAITFTVTDSESNIQVAKVAFIVTEYISAPQPELPDGELVDDFEGGTWPVNRINTIWVPETDETATSPTGSGSSVINSMEIVSGGANGTANALKVEYTLNKGVYQYQPYVIALFSTTDTITTPEGTRYDFTGSTGISFWHKGDGLKVRPTLPVHSGRPSCPPGHVCDWGFHEAMVERSDGWQLVVLNWSDFNRPGWANPAFPLGPLQNITDIQWMVMGADMPGEFSGEFWIDEVQINKEAETGKNEIIAKSEGTTVVATRDNLVIYSNYQISEVSLINVQGATVSTQKVQNDFAKISITNLPQGVYLAKITYDGKQPEVVKFIK